MSHTDCSPRSAKFYRIHNIFPCLQLNDRGVVSSMFAVGYEYKFEKRPQDTSILGDQRLWKDSLLVPASIRFKHIHSY